ncbi:MAG: bifunctional [glutamine synthetase] adenylyltransferase/[glutamine synthetase]-adenylyl-L-tyrosine phosphorylase, partial [Hyphomicrobium sp.]
MDNSSAVDAGFVERIAEWPVAAPDDSADVVLRELIELAGADPALAGLSARLRDRKVAALLLGTFSGSPYLKGLVLRDLARLATIIEQAPELTFVQWRRDLESTLASVDTLAEAMKAVRVFKSSVALLTALCDLAGIWPVMTVTKVLTETADATLGGGIRFLFRTAAERGDWLPEDPGRAEIGSGYIVLGMGKYGAGELNYSSDIDLIVFYDLERLRLKPGLEPQPFFVRLTRDVVRLMDERTAHGYVFRTDLRLRPDAGATQIAMSTDSALHYYEAFGQNWERAAMIKARAVAGDIEAGELLLQDLAPFVWRKYLDFAAIADVHAMKRQIHAFRGFGGIAVAGHNVKLGRGGIREIEFFAQTQQLIAGGRQPQLRSRETLVTLAGLVAKAWITEAIATELGAAYRYLRRIEHRLQMVADEQTHEMPETAESLDGFARFAGYATLDQLAAAMVPVLETVQRHYAALFEDMPELTAHSSNMVFAGEGDDPATVETLKKMGFSQPSQVLATVRAWHHGRSRAVRSARSRERLTEVQPLLIQALSETADPDRALSAFDRFVSELPDGVQLFSLLRANPKLLRLVADIMGTAPRLASILSRRRRLLDAVLDPRTFAALPSAAEIDDVLSREIT